MDYYPAGILSMKTVKLYKRYVLPGFVFQSIVIGGGYGTGRELVEFFLTQGPAGGYLGMLLATTIWGAVGLLVGVIGRSARPARRAL